MPRQFCALCIDGSELGVFDPLNVSLQELDFTIETANAERCRKNLQSPRSHVRGGVKVIIFRPVHWQVVSIMFKRKTYKRCDCPWAQRGPCFCRLTPLQGFSIPPVLGL